MASLSLRRARGRRAAWLLCALALGGCASPAPPPPLPAPPPRQGLRLAGADEARPLLLHLLQIFASQEPGEPLTLSALPDEGARRALEAGIIDGAILFDEAPTPGLRVARTRAIILAGPGVGGQTLSVEALGAILRGVAPPWPSGRPARLLSRQPGAAAQAALLRAAGLSALAARRKARPIHEDQALREALALTPGGIGVSDEGSSAFYGSPLWRLPIKGLSPALYIRLLLSPDPPPRLRRFAAFIQGAEARRVITELGYTP